LSAARPAVSLGSLDCPQGLRDHLVMPMLIDDDKMRANVVAYLATLK
jgi:hypothetical protein